MANKRLNKFTCNALLINKEFNNIKPQDITIYGSEPIKSSLSSLYPEIIYTVDIPKHIYDRLVDKVEGYDSLETFKKKNELSKKNGNQLAKHKYFKKYIESPLISQLIKELEDLSQKILDIENDKERQGDKKIFVRFNGITNIEKCNWTGGYMGNNTKSNFQYFTGYEIESPKSIFDRELTKKYMTNILYKSGSLKNHYLTESIETIEIGDNYSIYKTSHLHPLYMDNSQNFNNFLATFKIIDWTQEREDFFRTLEEKFKKLNDDLNHYLSDLDNNKVDELITNNKHILLP